MEISVFVFCKFFGLFLGCILLIFAAGRLILQSVSSIFKVRGFFQTVFFSLSLGVFAIVIVSSVVRTHFITVSTGFFLVAAFLVYELWRAKAKGHGVFVVKAVEVNHGKKEKWTYFFFLIFLSLLFFSWQAFMVLKSGGFPFIVPHHNEFFYSEVSEIIWQTGHENTYQAGNLVNRSYGGTIPYHYFELWLGGFFAWLFQVSNLLSLQLLVFPLFFLMMAIGLFSVAESFFPVTVKGFLFVFSLLFIGGVPFVVNDLPPFSFQWVTNIESPLVYEKSAHLYWIALIGFLLMINEFFTGGFLVFVSLVFVSGTLLPGVLGGGLIFLLLSALCKIEKITWLLKQLVYFSSLILFFFFFYFLSGNNQFSFRSCFPALHYTDLSPFLQNGFDFFTIKVFLVELVFRIYKIPLNVILSLIPFFVLVMIVFLKKAGLKGWLGRSFLLVVSAFLSAVISSGIFYKMWDSWQFVENFYFFILVFFALSFIFLYSEYPEWHLKKWLALFFLFVFLFKGSSYMVHRHLARESLYGAYSDEYLMKISALPGTGNSLGVFFHSLSGLERSLDPIGPVINRIGGYTDFMPQFSSAVDLSVMDLTHWDSMPAGELETAALRTSPFFIFVEEQKRSGAFVSVEKSQVDFMDEHKIRYGIASANASIGPLAEKRIVSMIVDSKSGERFMLFE